MSNTPFVESLSADPVERAIARKVNRILNDKSLDRQQRVSLIKKAQRQLLLHRQQQQAQKKLQAQVAAVSLPKGYKPQCIQVRDGQVLVAVVQPRHNFIWLEAGVAPSGLAANQCSFAPAKQSRRDKGAGKSPVLTRQQELHIKSAPSQTTDLAA